jgi:hypothetical protein
VCNCFIVDYKRLIIFNYAIYELAVVQQFSMQKTLPAILILLIFLSCEQTKKQTVERDNLYFQALISPAFDEHAVVTVSKIDSTHKIQFLLRNAYGNDKFSDTFYFKTATLSESQFHKIDTELLQKIITGHSIQKRVIRDGMWVGFTLVHKGDTSMLSFDNPQKGTDSAAYEIIKNGIDNFQSIFNDTTINNYLYEVQTYIDNSKKDSSLNDKWTIDKLRRIKYSH